jgi:hypothetical protein
MYALWDTRLKEWARTSVLSGYDDYIEDEITVAILVFDSEEGADKARKLAFGGLWETYEIREFPT